MEIVYQDALLAVINKPAGIPSLPSRSGSESENILGWARAHLHPEANLLHRLDQPTSGLLVISWDKETFRALYEQFASHTVEKKYWALVQGEVEFEAAELTAPIAADPPRVDPHHGKLALTIAHTVERFRGYSLVICVPATGRMHQVRLHLSYYGFPIVGDEAYGGRPLYLSAFHRGYKSSNRHPERPLHPPYAILLHAGYLKFFHPGEGRSLTVEAALPSYFEVALRQLRKWAARSLQK
ncbi:MAG: RluA family pseudouridine synthase [Bacteroidia bacterium]